MGGEEKRVAVGGDSVCVGIAHVSSIWKWWGCVWSSAPTRPPDHSSGGGEGKCGLGKGRIGGERVK